MNANSAPPAPTTIKDWLAHATRKLKEAGIASASLDAAVLLADALDKNRAWLVAHDDYEIPDDAHMTLAANLKRRIKREPLAYIRGYKDFYGRMFKVTPDTLIPRPETEVMIELLAPLVTQHARMIDVGTGSGVIAITAALEYTELTVEACDVSTAALKVAKENADLLSAEVTFCHSGLIEETHDVFDIICANLPYVDRSWEVSEETNVEPSLALYADDNGLALIKKLIEQASERLTAAGYLLLEADPRQHDAIVAFGHAHDFDWFETRDFIVVLQKR